MYILDFANRVREAQGYGPLEHLPASGNGCSPLELAMGCRLEAGLMRMSTPQAAQAVAHAVELPLGYDRVTIALPTALGDYAGAVEAARAAPAQEVRSEAV